MRIINLMSVSIVICLVAGCSIRTVSSPPPTSQSSQERIERPEPPVTIEKSPLGNPPPSPTIPHRPPPAVETPASTAPIERAKIDLAHRLHADVSLIKVDEVATRSLDEEVVACLSASKYPKEMQAYLNDVQWISLSVKGNLYIYVALGELIFFCNGKDSD